jgi:hypothetical protein
MRKGLTHVAVLLPSLLLLALGSPVIADQPVFQEDPTGVGMEVRASGTPETTGKTPSPSSDPKVRNVTCQFRVGQTGGGLVPVGGLQQQPSLPPCAATAIRTIGITSTGITPEVLARQAYRFLPLPAPLIRTSPPPTQDQLVNMATWLWVDGTTWGTRTASASVPGLAVTVTAVPVTVIWRMGDGGEVVCDGPGTPFDPTTAASGQAATCSYIYRRSSAGQPAGQFTVTATTTWRITWTATGLAASGSLPPLTRTSQTALRVAEVQAINTP